MSKAIGETWKAVWDHHIDAWDLTLDNQDETILAHRGGFLTSDDPGYDEARAKLAAQAPAMARLLLRGMEVTTANAYGNESTCLAECGGWGPTADQHASGCDLVAVLRAAGVIE